MAPSQTKMQRHLIGDCRAVAQVPISHKLKAKLQWSPRLSMASLTTSRKNLALIKSLRGLQPKMLKDVQVTGKTIHLTLANRAIGLRLKKAQHKQILSFCLRRIMLDDTKTLAMSLRALPASLVPAPPVPSASKVKAPRNSEDATHVQAWSDYALTPARSELLRQALQQAPHSAMRFRTMYMLAHKSFSQGHLAEAEELSLQAVLVAPPAYKLLFASLAALCRVDNVSLLQKLISEGAENAAEAQAWRGVAYWRAGQYQQACKDLIAAEQSFKDMDKIPGLRLLLADALRIDGQNKRALQHFKALAKSKRPDCSLAAARMADMAAINGDYRLLRKSLRACPAARGLGKELLQLCSFEFSGHHDILRDALPYEKLIKYKRAPAFNDALHQRWARALFIRGDDDKAFWVLHQVKKPNNELLKIIASAAVSKSIAEERNLDAALITALVPGQLRDDSMLRKVSRAYDKLDLPHQRIGVLLSLVQRAKEQASDEDLLDLARAYRDAGERVRLRLLQNYLRERGLSLDSTQKQQVDAPLNSCANISNTYAQAQCWRDLGQMKRAKNCLKGDSPAQRALQRALQMSLWAKPAASATAKHTRTVIHKGPGQYTTLAQSKAKKIEVKP